MSRERLTISFPVIDAPSHVGSGRVILLQFAPIPDARRGVAPTMGRVIGMMDNGALVQFSIPIRVWEEAKRAPVYFVEASDVRGPAGALVDRAGNTLVGVG